MEQMLSGHGNKSSPVGPPSTLAPPCGPHQFFCYDSDNCIFDSWVCDQMVECEHGEDELNCPGNVRFWCVSDLKYW